MPQCGHLFKEILLVSTILWHCHCFVFQPALNILNYLNGKKEQQQKLDFGWISYILLSLTDLVMVFDAIQLKSRQACEKLQCLYENLMSNNFRKMALLKKYEL